MLRHDAAVHRPLVVLVDDQPDVLRLVAAFLDSGGYDVAPANSPEDALAILQSRTADLLLTDVVMHESMDGAELALAAKELRSDLPVLFMSGYDEGRLERYWRKHGDADLIRKPFAVADLLSAVHAALENHSTSAS